MRGAPFTASGNFPEAIRGSECSHSLAPVRGEINDCYEIRKNRGSEGLRFSILGGTGLSFRRWARRRADSRQSPQSVFIYPFLAGMITRYVQTLSQSGRLRPPGLRSVLPELVRMGRTTKS